MASQEMPSGFGAKTSGDDELASHENLVDPSAVGMTHSMTLKDQVLANSNSDNQNMKIVNSSTTLKTEPK